MLPSVTLNSERPRGERTSTVTRVEILERINRTTLSSFLGPGRGESPSLCRDKFSSPTGAVRDKFVFPNYPPFCPLGTTLRYAYTQDVAPIYVFLNYKGRPRVRLIQPESAGEKCSFSFSLLYG
jgi:hypothetical protein